MNGSQPFQFCLYMYVEVGQNCFFFPFFFLVEDPTLKRLAAQSLKGL